MYLCSRILEASLQERKTMLSMSAYLQCVTSRGCNLGKGGWLFAKTIKKVGTRGGNL